MMLNTQKQNSTVRIKHFCYWIYSPEKTPYGCKGSIEKYHYRADIKLGKGIFDFRIFTCSRHVCQKQPSITWDENIEYACN